jgi:hypothetical protein
VKRFYKAAITKRSLGSAVEHREPGVEGQVIVKVTDSTTAGDYKLFLIDCNDAQHEANLNIPGIEEVSEEQAITLAAKYQPKRTLTRLNPLTRQEEKVTVPACDLKKFYED